ncbi:MAG TPA: hypothetical protein VF593_11605 [Chthoniobacteraceae bacterium]|jgi:acyl-coenzyme A synthetase/AMP-(fatty) acid ligase
MSAALEEYRELEARIGAGIEADENLPEDLWMAVFEFQLRWNEPYARFCAALPEPACWRDIPAVPQSAFKHALLSVVSSSQTGKTFLTSGTTGEGRGAHHFLDTSLYERAARAGWLRLDLPKLPHLVLAPSAADAPQSSLAHMFTALAPLAAATENFVDGQGRLDSARLIAALQRTTEPVGLLGTALAFLNLFEAMEEEHVVLPPGSFALETGGYKGSGREIPKAQLYAQFTEHLGLPPTDVLNEYGMTELSSQAYTRGLGEPHLAPPWLRFLVIDPETGAEVEPGESGVLRLFDLANLGSVVAVETQDLAVRLEDGFELIGRDPGAIPRGCSRQADESFRR